MSIRATRLAITVALMVLFAGCIVIERRAAQRAPAPGVTGDDLPKAELRHCSRRPTAGW